MGKYTVKYLLDQIESLGFNRKNSLDVIIPELYSDFEINYDSLVFSEDFIDENQYKDILDRFILDDKNNIKIFLSSKDKKIVIPDKTTNKYHHNDIGIGIEDKRFALSKYNESLENLKDMHTNYVKNKSEKDLFNDIIEFNEGYPYIKMYAYCDIPGTLSREIEDYWNISLEVYEYLKNLILSK